MLQENILQIKPEIESHRTLEEDVQSYLAGLGYNTYSLPYHEVLDTETMRLLSNRYDPTALYLRARADRTAIHRKKSIQFEFDAKTHENRKYKDMTFEMYPAMLHIIKARLGVKTLYCYRDPYIKLDCGFWFDNPPPFRNIYIPPARRMFHLRDWFFELAKELIDERLIRTSHVGGTGDPFIIVSYSELLKLPDWRILINEITNNAR